MKQHRQLLYGMIAPNVYVAGALKLIDKAGFTFRRRRRPKPDRIDNLLLVFFGSFGDGLMFTSVLKPLRDALPDARIDVLASRDVGTILKGCPYVNHLIVTDMPSGKEYPSRVPGLIKLLRGGGTTYDAALCLRGPIDNGVLPLFLSGVSGFNAGLATGGFSFCLDEVVAWRSGVHETEHFQDIVRTILPSFEVGEQELFYDRGPVRAMLREKLMGLGIQPWVKFIVVHPGSKIMRRSLSIDLWRKLLLDVLAQTDALVLVTGVTEERPFYDSIGVEHPRLIPTLGSFNIPELAELLRAASFVITVETFVSHLAGLAGVPAVAFWTGVTDVRQWRPLGESVSVASVNPPCAPCFRWCDDPVCMAHDVQIAVNRVRALDTPFKILPPADPEQPAAG